MRLYYVPGESDQPPCSQGYGLLEYAAELQHSASTGACLLRDSIWRWALSDSSVVGGRGDAARGQAYAGAGAVGSRASMREAQQGAGTSTTTSNTGDGEGKATEGVTTITKLQFLERELELLRTAMAQAQAEELEPARDASAVAATASTIAAVATAVPSAIPSAAPIAIARTRSTAADAASTHTPVHDKARRPSMVDVVQQAASSVQLRRVSTNRQVHTE